MGLNCKPSGEMRSAFAKIEHEEVKRREQVVLNSKNKKKKAKKPGKK